MGKILFNFGHIVIYLIFSDDPTDRTCVFQNCETLAKGFHLRMSLRRGKDCRKAESIVFGKSEKPSTPGVRPVNNF